MILYGGYLVSPPFFDGLEVRCSVNLQSPELTTTNNQTATAVRDTVKSRLRRKPQVKKGIPSMKWMAFALVLIGISSSQVHYQWTSQKNLILFSVRHRWTNRPTVTETGVEPPKLGFADEFVHSPFLKMSSCFSFRASMNKGGACRILSPCLHSELDH